MTSSNYYPRIQKLHHSTFQQQQMLKWKIFLLLLLVHLLILQTAEINQHSHCWEFANLLSHVDEYFVRVLVCPQLWNSNHLMREHLRELASILILVSMCCSLLSAFMSCSSVNVDSPCIVFFLESVLKRVRLGLAWGGVLLPFPNKCWKSSTA